MEISYSYRKYPISFFLCIILSLLVWLAFYPGVFSIDSLFMVMNAKLGWYLDLHPVIVAYVVAFMYEFGIGIQILILLQILLAFFGLRRLILVVGRIAGPSNQRSLDWMIVFLILVFFSPFTPFAIYASTLWTDTWLYISLLWVLALLGEIYLDEEFDQPVKNYFGKIMIILFIILWVLLVRYNAFAVFPALSLMLAIILKRFRLNSALRAALLLSPLVVFCIFLVYQYKFSKVNRAHPEYAWYALDLASMIAFDPMVCTDLLIQSCTIVYHEFPEGFVVGNGAIDFTLNQGHPKDNAPFTSLLHYPRLRDEFILAVQDHPLLFAKVKVLNYLDYISPDPARYFYQDHFPENNFGIVFTQPNKIFVDQWLKLTNAVIWHPVARWLSFVHAPWLLVNLLQILVCLGFYRRSPRARILLLILLVPASYYASYLVVLTASEFRFMYPAMLLVQVVTFTLAYSYIARWLAERNILNMSMSAA